MKKKKILVVCQHYWPENFRINDICNGFVEFGYDVEVLCGIPNYPKGVFYPGYSILKKRKEIKNGIKVRRVSEIPRKGNSNIMILLNYLSYPFFSLFHIPRLLFKDYDYIFIYELSPVLMALPGILLGKLKKIPTTMYVLDLWPENLFSVLKINNKTARKIAFSVSNWHYKNVNKLICISEGMRERLDKTISGRSIDVTVIPQFCEKIYEERIVDKELVMRFKNTFNIVYTGNISPAQSFSTVIEVAKLIKKDGEFEDLRFVIVGDGMSKCWLEKEVQTNNLNEMFIFEGSHPIERMPAYLNIADSLLGCLSKSEQLGLTIPAKVMSYIASGKPLLLAMDGEAQKLINEVNCGFACNSEDILGLYKNIKIIYNMSIEERQCLGENGYLYHLKNLERNTNLNKLIKFSF